MSKFVEIDTPCTISADDIEVPETIVGEETVRLLYESSEYRKYVGKPEGELRDSFTSVSAAIRDKEEGDLKIERAIRKVGAYADPAQRAIAKRILINVHNTKGAISALYREQCVLLFLLATVTGGTFSEAELSAEIEEEVARLEAIRNADD